MLKLRPLVLPLGHWMRELKVPYWNRVVERHREPPRWSKVRVMVEDSGEWVHDSGQ